MKFRCIQLLLLVVLSVPFTASAEPNIDVAVIFSSDTSLSSFEKAALTAELQLEANAAVLNSTRSLTFSFSPLLSSVSYNANGKDDAQAVQWLIDENADLFSIVSIWRETSVFGGADIILMLVDDWADTACGVAVGPAPLTTNVNNHNTHAFAVVALNSGGVCDRTEVVVPHELGHVLYSEHETEDNGDSLLPAFDNHAIDSTSGSTSVMWSSVSGATLPVYSGFLSGLSGPFADNDRFFAEESWDIVSSYRPILPPSQPSGHVGLLFCISWNAFHYVDWGGQLNYSSDYFEVQRKEQLWPWLNIWYPFFEGGAGGTEYITQDHQADFRVRVVTVGGVPSTWFYFWTYANCVNAEF